MVKWHDPIGFLKGVTPAVRKAFAVLGIHTVEDALRTVPRRYEDYSRVIPIGDAQHGVTCTIRGSIHAIKKGARGRHRQWLQLVIRDESGSVGVVLFNQPWLKDAFKQGDEVFVSGTIEVRPPYGRQMTHAIVEKVDPAAPRAGQILPVYGLSGSLAQKTYRRVMTTLLEECEPPAEALDEALANAGGALTLAQAVRAVHAPTSLDEAERGRERLAIEEMFFFQLALGMFRASLDETHAPQVAFSESFAKAFVQQLPFTLTGDQKRAAWSVLQDMQRDTPMRRMLQGDVGSGKTVIAAFAAASAQRGGASAIVMAPTEILAQQHASTFERCFHAFHIPVLLYTRTERISIFDGTRTTLTSAQAQALIEQGNIVIVGTHALLYGERIPADTALVVVDEQHRFGVLQRELMSSPRRADGLIPHLLSMTATPIPRTLALTLYGDLDLTRIREKPVGRKPIITHVCVGEDRARAYGAAREAIARGERVYVVCPLIDASDTLGSASVNELAKKLASNELQGISLGILHGKLSTEEKQQALQAFSAGTTPVLVATSVIEVGVDVPQATVMIIESSDRFGLAQLHQLRGRVGRSALQSSCYLLIEQMTASLARLKLLTQYQDGLDVSEADLQMRGAGNLLGVEQSGETRFRACRWSDVDIIERAQTLARETLEQDPALEHHSAWRVRAQTMTNVQHGE